MNRYDTLYEKTYKKLIIGVICFITASYIMASFLYHPFPLHFTVKYIFLIGSAVNLTSIVLVYAIPINHLKRLIKIYTIVNNLLVGYTVIFSLKIGLDGTLFWLFALPILTFVADFSKKIIWWMVFYVCLLLVIFSYLYFSKSLPPVNNWMMIKVKYNNIIDIFFPFLLICYSLYYKHRLTEIKTAQLIHSIDTNNQNKDILIMGNEDYKYHKIYKQIEEYVETKRPYLNPDFKISKMAHDLNINTGYITKSIQKFKKTNFNNFINIYRIENVKKLIQADTTSKYTLEYIYLSSGFKNQSSFNRIFKLQTGIAPSEYYKQFCEENKSEKISQ